jgi:hypothetical protein
VGAYQEVGKGHRGKARQVNPPVSEVNLTHPHSSLTGRRGLSSSGVRPRQGCVSTDSLHRQGDVVHPGVHVYFVPHVEAHVDAHV